MTTEASLASDAVVSPQLARARTYLALFGIIFERFFQKPRPETLPAETYRKACGWLRGLEAIARRVLFIEAAALIPGLPPSRPEDPASRKAETASTTDAPVESAAITAEETTGETLGCASFSFMKRPASADKASSDPRAAHAPPPARNPTGFPRDDLPFRPLGRRFNAVCALLQDPAAAARRLAFRIRAIQARAGMAMQFIFKGVRLDPEPAVYMGRDVDIFSCDANDALRAAARDESG